MFIYETSGSFGFPANLDTLPLFMVSFILMGEAYFTYLLSKSTKKKISCII